MKCIVCKKETDKTTCSDKCAAVWEEALYELCEENKRRRENYDTFSEDDIIENCKCVVTGNKVNFQKSSLHLEKKPVNDIERRKYINSICVDDAITGIIAAGYGSKYDGDYFFVALSDEAIDKLLAEGKIKRAGYYF